MVEGAELVALEMYRQCRSSRQPLAMSMVERALHQLRGHPTGCVCGVCTAAAEASADAVYRVATV